MNDSTWFFGQTVLKMDGSNYALDSLTEQYWTIGFQKVLDPLRGQYWALIAPENKENLMIGSNPCINYIAIDLKYKILLSNQTS